MEPLVIRVSDASKLLSIGRTTMYKLIAAGEIPSVRVGESLRIPVAELKAWIQQETVIRSTRCTDS